MEIPNKYKKLLKPVFIEDSITLDQPSDLIRLGYGEKADLEWIYEYHKKEYSKRREQLVSALNSCDFIFKWYIWACGCGNDGYGRMFFNYHNLPKHSRRKKDRRNKNSKFRLIPDRRTSKRRIYDLGFCGYKIVCPKCNSKSILKLPFGLDVSHGIYAFVKDGFCLDNGLRIMINDSQGGEFFVNEFRDAIKRKLVYRGHLEWDITCFDKKGSGHRYFESNYKIG